MKTIGVRDFLRGAYKDLEEPVLVMSHSKPLGVWTPSGDQDHLPSTSYSSSSLTYSTPTGYTTAPTGTWWISEPPRNRKK